MRGHDVWRPLHRLADGAVPFKVFVVGSAAAAASVAASASAAAAAKRATLPSGRHLFIIDEVSKQVKL